MNTAQQLFVCDKLNARISLASCEANRQKPDKVNLAHDKPLRPKQCDNCTDWQVWMSASLPETDTALLESRVNDLEKELVDRKKMSVKDIKKLKDQHLKELAERDKTYTETMEQFKATCTQMMEKVTQEADDALALWHEVFENASAVTDILCELAHARSKHPVFAKDRNHALALLMEEVGEAAAAINDDDGAGARKGLAQVAAVCVRFLEETNLYEM